MPEQKYVGEMKRREISTDDLAVGLHEDISRADMALAYREQVIAPLQVKSDFQPKFPNVFAQMFVATMTHSFMTISRLYDKAKTPFAINLEQLVNRVERERGDDRPNVRKAAAEYRDAIATVREKLARLRNTVFAHKAYDKGLPQITWQDLIDACDLAKKILVWYGSYFGRHYVFRTSGFDADCKRFVKAQIGWSVSVKQTG